MIKKEIVVNGIPRRLVVNGEDSLATVLRESLGLTGTKVGCNEGQCGACSVLIDGKVTRSCATKMRRVTDGAKITTIEGIGTPDNLHPLQVAWMVHGGAQCGFCTPGMLVAGTHLLEQRAVGDATVVREGLAGNLCRCTGYNKIIDSVLGAGAARS